MLKICLPSCILGLIKQNQDCSIVKLNDKAGGVIISLPPSERYPYKFN